MSECVKRIGMNIMGGGYNKGCHTNNVIRIKYFVIMSECVKRIGMNIIRGLQ